MIAKQLENASGNPIKNQFILWDDNGNSFFQSYHSIIARRDAGGKITLDRDSWDFSVTTGKYRNLFLHETKQETLKKIKQGIYTLDNLNPD